MVIGNEEHKQRVNLSATARTVLDTDFALFGARSRSGFMNRIIETFMPRAEASIDCVLDEYREQLADLLTETDDSCQKQVLIDTLAEDRRRHLRAKIEAYPKGESLLFRLNNANFDRLYDQQAEAENYKTPAKYLKAIFEEYARLSPCERERIYFSDIIEQKIQPAIDAGYLLETTLNTGTYLIRPYAVLADTYGTHVYLVGRSRPKDDPQDRNERIVSVRISRIEKVTPRRRHRFGKLTPDDKRDIEEKLRTVGVQYLVGDAETVTLRLTPTGQRQFLQRAHLRPQPEHVSADGVYTFHCSSLQILHFFTDFGKDVEVLTPSSLREQFARQYREALEIYET